MLMLLGWVGSLVLGKPVPIWLEGLTAANLYLTANCRSASDTSGEVLLRAMALSAQWFFAVLIGLWFTYTMVAEIQFAFHARALVWMVLGFSSFCEAAYAFFQREKTGRRWLVGLAPALVLAVLTVLAF